MPTLSPEFVAARDAFAQWYDNLSPEKQELVDSISDATYYIIEEQDYERFIDMLDDEFGITTAIDFEDKFCREFEGYGDSQLADYAQELIEDCYGLNATPAFVTNHIDWEAVWNCELRFDYSEIQFQENTYLFHNH